jgi:hypothetical protein
MSKFRFRRGNAYSLVGFLIVHGHESTQPNRAEVDMLQQESQNIGDIVEILDYAMCNRSQREIPRVTGLIHGQLNSLGGVLDFERLMFAGIEFR